MKKIIIIISLLIAIPALVFADDRLIVKDSGGITRYTVKDTGTMTIVGKETGDIDFKLQITGKSGGTTHTQMVTGDANSRLTIMAAEIDDVAPRFAAVGPQDELESIRGWALFDFGSRKYDLPDAKFTVRHFNTSGGQEMISVFGRDAVTFPKTDVMVGVRTDNPQHAFQVNADSSGTTSAYSDGAEWITASSREFKENIQELKSEEALEVLKDIKPVKFNYKYDAEKEINVGFIAEEVPDLVAVKGRKGLASLEVVAVLTKVVQQQQEMIAKLNEEVKSLKDQMESSAGN